MGAGRGLQGLGLCWCPAAEVLLCLRTVHEASCRAEAGGSALLSWCCGEQLSPTVPFFCGSTAGLESLKSGAKQWLSTLCQYGMRTLAQTLA